MVSSFYSSNEKKQKSYIKNRVIKEFNEEKQQQVVDDSIAEELGLQQEASNLSKLATRVINKIGNELIPKSFNAKLQEQNFTPIEYLKYSIENGNLSGLIDDIKALPDSLLNKVQRLLKRDLNNPQIKDNINDGIIKSIPYGSEAITNALIQNVAGKAHEKDFLQMIKFTENAKIGRTKSLPETEFKEPEVKEAEKSKRGRKKGSKNKPKTETN